MSFILQNGDSAATRYRGSKEATHLIRTMSEKVPKDGPDRHNHLGKLNRYLASLWDATDSFDDLEDIFLGRKTE